MASAEIHHPTTTAFRRDLRMLPTAASGMPSSTATSSLPPPLPVSSSSSSITAAPIATASAGAGAAEADSPPAIIVDRTANVTYMRGKFLGKGGFARCYELTNMETRQLFAGKIVSKATLLKHRAKEKLATEIKIHRSLHHAHIVGFHSFFEDKDNVYIVLELCNNKSLMELVKRRKTLTEPEVRFFMLQLVDACEYMHRNAVIHRDLKLGNLFLNDNLEIKVGDFGLATNITYEGERKKTLCGTPNYIAPEILENVDGHSYEVDVWSIGCVLYTMLIGRPPFETSNIKTTYRKIKLNDYKIPHTAMISDEAVSLIRASLDKNPACRPTVAAMRAHPFLSQGFIPASLPVTILTVAPHFEAAKKTVRREPLRSINADSADSIAISAKPATHLAIIMDKARSVSGAATSSSSSAQPSSHGSGESAAGVAGTATMLPSTDSRPMMVLEAADHKDGAASRASAAREEPRDTLTATHRYLTDLLSRQSKTTPSAAPACIPTGENGGLWISKWVDYSNKYGLGYQLSDGSVGVLFNDGTKMVLAPDNKHIQSIERDANGPVAITMTVDNYPEAVTKKVTLLKYFRSYMLEHLLNGADQASTSTAHLAGSLVHVKKWLRTKHAIVFRLSNGVIQINFFDHTKLVVNVPALTTTYIDKDRKSSTYYLEAVASSNHSATSDLVSRLSYATDVVEHLITMGRQRHLPAQKSSQA